MIKNNVSHVIIAKFFSHLKFDEGLTFRCFWHFLTRNQCLLCIRTLNSEKEIRFHSISRFSVVSHVILRIAFFSWLKFNHQFLFKRFKIKLRVIAAIVIVLGFTNYILQIASLAYFLSKSAEMKNQTIDSPLSHFIFFHLPYVFSYVPFSVPLGLFVEVSIIPLFFVWFYMELFVMMVSIGLVARFQQVNERLDHIRGQVRYSQKFGS
jgi:hypothetical protein